MTQNVKNIYSGYARAMQHRGESWERLATRAAVAEAARKSLLAEGFSALAWNLEGEVSGYYDLMRGCPQ